MSELHDTVFIRNLVVQTIIGIHPWERTTPQTVLISLEVQTETANAAAYDDITNTVDYAVLAERVSEFVSQAEFQLIETLAESIAALMLDDFEVMQVSVEVQKPGAIANTETVGVRIQRARDN
ncbi:MAG: dihydroneopterin aldolase [Gammaproteobacteria bacterium]|nr:dihydroneopterin aldolase [Gammaproteobacteria bacterium]MCZ6854360.1 dihydroneopterin aldolase [Gammaproteobacteria bacterium]